MELLVPPRRLGRVLAEARVSRGMSLSDVANALGGPLDGGLDDLAVLEIETGRRPVTDHELEMLASLYEMETSTLVPSRSRLVVDLDEGLIRAQSGEATLSDDEGDTTATPDRRQAVLAKYLALVYSMRGAEPGTTVALRIDDLDVLAETLGVDRRRIEDELTELMSAEPEPVKRRFRLLRGRLMVPAVGIMVAATAAGALLLVPASESSATSDPGGSAAESTDEARASDTLPANPNVDIGTAAVQERGPDGTPGSVEIRG